MKDGQLVSLTAESLAQSIACGCCFEQEDFSNYYHSFLRLSEALSISNRVFTGYLGTNCSIMTCANINFVWASLIVEECVRLGLTYFCIAPGSRSSPLAVSACRHPQTTCISCFDERSLSFHAVGYARGSGTPAVVVTSSGTAVSNLLPAVVEASHSFIPLVLLTADRPPELLDAGANQAIDQINHFGKFVRFFFSLPPPNEEVPARMVLTTMDSAVYHATQPPYGPVHVNCHFREPLDDQPRAWSSDYLRGLNCWMSTSEAFTKYIKMRPTCGCNGHGQIAEVLQAIQSAKNGILLYGDIQTEDDIWASLLLAKHLAWPVVTDILSGLRLRRQVSSFPGIEDCFLFIDHLDHTLLSDIVKRLVKPDVVIQIGSRITSKRIGKMLESCSLHTYVLVDKHPNRYDPSHIVTHRIQSGIPEFVDVLTRINFSRTNRKWGALLKELDMMVSNEISLQISSECSLTEPYVAHVITKYLQDDDDALFIGNSMAIRDVDMYADGKGKSYCSDVQLMSNLELLVHFIQVTGNRGASGIDGLLSTAVGFAVGSNKRVLCMVGDVSFLHDTNGLNILNQCKKRKPMTILVINNHGGAIFSLLPIATTTEPSVLDRYFYTSHDILIGQLCAAHGVKHLRARTKVELQHALQSSRKEQRDCLIEVESCIEDNANYHSVMRASVSEAVDQACHVLSKFVTFDRINDTPSICKITKMEYSVYRIKLCAPPTSSLVNDSSSSFNREGLILSLELDDGSLGFGEVAPLEIHQEDMEDVEEQVRFLLDIIKGVEISCLFSLLKGSISCWIWRCLGVQPSSIFPSVRCGLEMAILNALAARCGCSLSDVLSGYKSAPLGNLKSVKSELIDDVNVKKSTRVQISALVDCKGTPKSVAHVVSQLVEEGFTTIKLKVARRESPIEDAIVIQEIRVAVGYQIDIRVDANQMWTYKEALQFASLVKDFDLAYIEEPVCLESDIIKFYEETGIPVALDETVDNIRGDIFEQLEKFVHSGIVALVIKPSVVGGFENAAMIARWAQLHDKMAVISSAFESGLSLSAYIQFAYYLEQQNAAICSMRNKKCQSTISHGLGTYRWLKQDISNKPLIICAHPDGDTIEAAVEDAEFYLRNFQINHKVIQRAYRAEQVRSYHLDVNTEEFSYSTKFQEVGLGTNNKAVIFLHGFLGTSEDWIPVMRSLSATTRCISIDLPGHGESKLQSKQGFVISLDLVTEILHKLICDVTSGGVILVGYSMGARIALHMALKYKEKIHGAVIISGSPGLRDEAARRVRAAQDDARARNLLTFGLQRFLETWYSGKLWTSLRSHPHFQQILSSRSRHDDIQTLAKSLSGLSTGRQRSLWEDLKDCSRPLLLIVGETDTKFREISKCMFNEINNSRDVHQVEDDEPLCDMLVVPNSGHAVHLENPLPVINAIRKFITRLS
ncbi:isochorismate synthase / 2-succinyl-5-enolpyruvyl-6-hydroxy-3-cyclohexene-1-carboxylate synthase / 2-succinyl-6-hydroxy-2,4-cyclohexadiene-1-carboxylate synthase / O-succinylbenzoate synthase protein [Dioscorea alata]|uniref:Isochorismate synthase / 2-succinyl-5-enolpyruvyl-6-hydroxy-3-cyclohexene-1-carboxylate synthase / 2-succinyl-6-hydroxy-2,4-cyclohexadiene-1-carboxylate synthase / O-succinylbenzoate synthase protein n=1 Tax=Dioscorea alata TaxID=55571 RepID=A0ACB7WM02_DIOAL|nr:isochorismate synthase / 2-succinyl-5-enolpyruvyl-6-hydroxy-3-cyclohexene-1-carboxylate synthase / 2-succinyl-6-hydroxy-2,4-cyclohexadiene-1-carboxylate synthase / O-succinylbenzoate synthase protein [Dioscorea alata]